MIISKDKGLTGEEVLIKIKQKNERKKNQSSSVKDNSEKEGEGGIPPTSVGLQIN